MSDMAEAWYGRWTGSNLLRLSWLPEPEHRSDARAVIAPEAGGKFCSMRYHWWYEGIEHEGLLLMGWGDHAEAATAAWCDSWHMNARLMFCTGKAQEDGRAILRGSYAAPPGPDWGWRIEFSMPIADTLTLRMFNIDPNAIEELAVQADFVRDRS